MQVKLTAMAELIGRAAIFFVLRMLETTNGECQEVAKCDAGHVYMHVYIHVYRHVYTYRQAYKHV